VSETARKRVVTRQRLTPAVLDSLTTAVNNICWQDMYAMDDYRDQANFFYNHMNCVINETVPTYTVKPSSTDRPWVTTYFKSLIAKRGRAFAQSNYGRPLSVSGRPCYFANVFIYLFFFYGRLILRPWLTEARENFTRGRP